MVRSFDMNQFNNKFHQDFTRSTHIKSTQIGSKVKKGPIDSKLVNGASTFGDYQKASTTTKKPSTKTSTTGEATGKSSGSKSGKAAQGNAKGGDASFPEGKTKTKVDKDGTGAQPKKTTTSSNGVKAKASKAGINYMTDNQIEEDQDNEDDGYENDDKKSGGGNSDPMMGFNVYSMEAKAMLTGKK